jgi:hypothetical protein
MTPSSPDNLLSQVSGVHESKTKLSRLLEWN